MFNVSSKLLSSVIGTSPPTGDDPSIEVIFEITKTTNDYTFESVSPSSWNLTSDDYVVVAHANDSITSDDRYLSQTYRGSEIWSSSRVSQNQDRQDDQKVFFAVYDSTIDTSVTRIGVTTSAAGAGGSLALGAYIVRNAPTTVSFGVDKQSSAESRVSVTVATPTNGVYFAAAAIDSDTLDSVPPWFSPISESFGVETDFRSHCVGYNDYGDNTGGTTVVQANLIETGTEHPIIGVLALT